MSQNDFPLSWPEALKFDSTASPCLLSARHLSQTRSLPLNLVHKPPVNLTASPAMGGSTLRDPWMVSLADTRDRASEEMTRHTNVNPGLCRLPYVRLAPVLGIYADRAPRFRVPRLTPSHACPHPAPSWTLISPRETPHQGGLAPLATGYADGSQPDVRLYWETYGARDGRPCLVLNGALAKIPIMGPSLQEMTNMGYLVSTACKSAGDRCGVGMVSCVVRFSAAIVRPTTCAATAAGLVPSATGTGWLHTARAHPGPPPLPSRGIAAPRHARLTQGACLT